MGVHVQYDIWTRSAGDVDVWCSLKKEKYQIFIGGDKLFCRFMRFGLQEAKAVQT